MMPIDRTTIADQAYQFAQQQKRFTPIAPKRKKRAGLLEHLPRQREKKLDAVNE